MIARANRTLMKCCGIFALMLCMLSPAQAQWFGLGGATAAPLTVSVNKAYIDVYAGPGRGYPVFHVLERNEVITLLYSRTDWIKIKTQRDLEGWIKRDDIASTLSPDGSTPDFPDPQQADYLVDRFELGAAYGDFAGADSLTLTLGYRFTKNLSGEIRYAENTGQFSDSQILAAAVLFQPFPEWRFSPFFSLGTGEIKTLPSATLVDTQDRKDNLMQASLGAYWHLSGRLFLRADYTNHYVLTRRNTNEEVNEWKVGFNVFF